MATISNTPRPGYVYDSTDAVWYPIGTGSHNHSEIPSTIVDAKGDIITASAADTPARLAVGNNGETLVADSSTATGLRYQPSQAAGRNTVINGGMDIWQRGTTFNSSSNYTADRWVVFTTAGTVNVTQSTDVPTSPYFTYSLQIAGVSSSGDILRGRMEAAQTTVLAGQTVTLSIYAKSSAGTAALKWNTQVPSVTDNFTTVVQDQSGTFSSSPSGSWTRYTATFTVSATAVRGYELRIYRDSSASSNTTLITGVQLELGSVATTFTKAGGTIQGELAACQRYYQRFNDAATSVTQYAQGQASSTTAAYFLINPFCTFRVKPTTLDVNLIRATDFNTGFTPSGSFSIYSSGTSPERVILTASTFSGLTQFRPYFLESAGSTSAFIGIGAEL